MPVQRGQETFGHAVLHWTLYFRRVIARGAAWVLALLLVIIEVKHDAVSPLVFDAVLVVLGLALVEIAVKGVDDIEALNCRIVDLATSTTGGLEPLLSRIDATAAELASSGNQLIRVDQLVLDMDHAWDRMAELIRDPRFRRVHVRILMVAGTTNIDLETTPADVVRWHERSTESLTRIGHFIAEEMPTISADRNIRIEIKTYDVLPTIHGFRVTEPISIWCFAFCRWKGSQYSWGERAFHYVRGQAQAAAIKDLTDVFDCQFTHLWEAGKAKFDSATADHLSLPGAAT